MLAKHRFWPFLSASLSVSWPWLVFMFVTMAVLFSGERPLLDGDTYMHIGIGDWIITHQTVPQVDVFSHTMAGQPWRAHEWLAQVILALVYQWGGWTGLVLLTGLCTATTLALLNRFMLVRMPPIYALGLTALSYLALLTHLLARPHVLTWPLIVLWTIGLLNAAEQRRAPAWWLLPVMLLWVNLHGGFILGFALLVPLFLNALSIVPPTDQARLAKAWGQFAVMVGLVSLLNPAGWGAYEFLFHLMGNAHLQYVSEWRPTDLSRFGALEVWIYVLLGMGLLGMLRLPVVQVMLVLGLLYQALAHVRYVSIFALLVPLLIARSFGQSYTLWQQSIAHTDRPGHRMASRLDAWFEQFKRPAGWLLWLVGSLLLAAVAVVCAVKDANRPAADTVPQAAVDAVLSAALSGPVFNHDGTGGYLVMRGIPVYRDGRADLYGAEFMRRQSELLDSKDPNFIQRSLSEAGVGWVILPSKAALVSQLRDMPGWQIFFEDANAIIFKPANMK